MRFRVHTLFLATIRHDKGRKHYWVIIIDHFDLKKKSKRHFFGAHQGKRILLSVLDKCINCVSILVWTDQ